MLTKGRQFQSFVALITLGRHSSYATIAFNAPADIESLGLLKGTAFGKLGSTARHTAAAGHTAAGVVTKQDAQSLRKSSAMRLALLRDSAAHETAL